MKLLENHFSDFEHVYTGFTYRTIDSGGNLSQAQAGLVHSHHPVPQFGCCLVHTSCLTHVDRDRPLTWGFKSHAKERGPRDNESRSIVAPQTSLHVFLPKARLRSCATVRRPVCPGSRSSSMRNSHDPITTATIGIRWLASVVVSWPSTS